MALILNGSQSSKRFYGNSSRVSSTITSQGLSDEASALVEPDGLDGNQQQLNSNKNSGNVFGRYGNDDKSVPIDSDPDGGQAAPKLSGKPFGIDLFIMNTVK